MRIEIDRQRERQAVAIGDRLVRFTSINNWLKIEPIGKPSVALVPKEDAG